MSAPLKRARRAAAEAKMAEPEFIDQVCELIIGMGTLDVIAKSLDIPYFLLHAWIHADSARVKQYAAALEARNQGLKEVVIGGMVRSATSDIRKMYDNNGKPVRPHEVPEELADVVVGMETSTDEDGERTTKFKLADRQHAQANLARVLGMFKDNVNLNVTGTLAQRLDAAAARRKTREKSDG